VNTAISPLRVLQVNAEIFPLLKTGGLADVAGALPAALRDSGVEVRLLLPGFPAILAGLQDVVEVVDLGGVFASGGARLLRGRLPACDGVTAYVIQSGGFYDRAGGPYADVAGQPYGDNHRRFALLGWVAAELAAGLDAAWVPEVVHAHDWHAALAPAYIHAAEHRLGRRLAATVYTVHNLAYQGLFDARHYDELELPDEWFSVHGVEFHGRISFMKAGLHFADRITTVSPTYAREIQGHEQGCGLEGLLRSRSDALVGILNGVDERVWHPQHDALLPHRFHTGYLRGKALCKTALQHALGLEAQAGLPLACVVSRLTGQKGLHLVEQVLPQWLEQGGQFVLLGSGDTDLEAAFRRLALQRPRQMALRIGYDEALAHRIIAGSDLIWVPSRYEPCGLTQLYGLAYGTLPVVRRVGGLADTVSDTRLETIDHDATGFVFDTFEASALSQALERARALWRRRTDWRTVQRRGMSEHHGWNTAATGYAEIYRQAKLHRRLAHF
jgi:starch synthase